MLISYAALNVIELIDTLWNVNVNILEKIEALEVEN